jgi:hypothetical protein
MHTFSPEMLNRRLVGLLAEQSTIRPDRAIRYGMSLLYPGRKFDRIEVRRLKFSDASKTCDGRTA